jgi:hypothetical protein
MVVMDRVARVIAASMMARMNASFLVFYCGLVCPMMKDATLKQIAAVKPIVSKGSHVSMWSHIWRCS